MKTIQILNSQITRYNPKHFFMKIAQFFPLLVLSLLFTACSDDDSVPEIINEEEVITTVNLTLTDNNDNVKILSFKDDDGNGPNAPVATADDLETNTTYTGSIVFLNELETPTENITAEVAEEDIDHQIFYVTSSSLNATVEYIDQDANGNPVGLDFTLTTGDVSSEGSLTVILRHEPNKDASGVSDGDPANAGGETDVEAVFTINIL